MFLALWKRNSPLQILNIHGTKRSPFAVARVELVPVVHPQNLNISPTAIPTIIDPHYELLIVDWPLHLL